MQDFTTSFLMVLQEAGASTAQYLPNMVAALAIFIIGALFARIIRGITVRVLDSLRLSNIFKMTPVEHLAHSDEIGKKIELGIASVVYWILMLIVIQTAVSVLGLTSLSVLLEKIVSYLPRIISAVLVLFLGVLLAGFVETIVKGALKTLDPRSGRAFGKVSSYLVMSFAVLVAISELGIARDFIMVLFVGFVMMIALGVGLAVGLGGKDLVKKILEKWYKDLKADIDKE